MTDDDTRCPDCGATLHAEADYCQGCGSVVPEPGPEYCSSCGESYDETDEYCSSCGKDRPPTDPATEPTDDPQRQEAFRRRVREYVNGGWELIEDTGDRVVIIDRSVGSIPVHALLLFFTAGVGNAIYGWYRYSASAETRRLAAVDIQSQQRVHDEEIETGADDLTTGAISSVAMVVGLALVLDGALTGITLGFLLFLVSVGLLPGVQKRLRQRRSLNDFGRHRRVEERLFGGIGDHTRLCIVCGEACDEGVQRRRRDETLVFGVPVQIHDSQLTDYCQDCAKTEPITEVVSLDETGWHSVSLSTTEENGDVGVSSLGSEESPSRSPLQSPATHESDSTGETESNPQSDEETQASRDGSPR